MSASDAQQQTDLQRFYTSWAWKREHLPDKDRFRRPYKYTPEQPGACPLTIRQAQFKGSEGFASTVWDSSIVVCKYLERHAQLVAGKRCLDLSAGCGLAAVVMSQLGAREVVATDLPCNLQLLKDNCQTNGAKVDVREHWWGRELEDLQPRFDLTVACDVMYVSELIPDLVQSLAATCAPEGQVLVAHGRNRGGETMFLEQVAKYGFSVATVLDEELHPVYQCSDVSVYRLTWMGPGSTAEGRVGTTQAGAGTVSSSLQQGLGNADKRGNWIKRSPGCSDAGGPQCTAASEVHAATALDSDQQQKQQSASRSRRGRGFGLKRKGETGSGPEAGQADGHRCRVVGGHA